MKKFSKLLAVVLAIAVVICPMMSVVANAAGTNNGSYSLKATDGGIELTIESTEGFLVYLATVAFSAGAAPETATVTSYSLVGDVDADNFADDCPYVPVVSANADGDNLTVLVASRDAGACDLYSKVVINFDVVEGTTAAITKLQAADAGDGATVESDPTLLGFAGIKDDGSADTESEDYKESGVIVPHVHSYTLPSDSEAVAATCTTNQFVYAKCECGEVSNTETLEVQDTKLGHSFTTKASDQKATDANCNDPATYYVQCDRCNEVDTTKTVAVGQANGHSFTTKASTTVKTPASCTAAAVYYVQCDNCTTVSDTVTVAVGDPLEHNYVWDGVEGNGQHTVVCQNGCHDSKLVDCDANNDGACSVCGYKAAPAGPVYDAALAAAFSKKTFGITDTFRYTLTVLLKNFDVSYTFDSFVVTKKVMTAPSYTYTDTPKVYTYGSEYCTNEKNRAYKFEFNDVGLYELGTKLEFKLIVNEGGNLCYYSWEESMVDLALSYYEGDTLSKAGKDLVADVLKLAEASRVFFANAASEAGYPDNSLATMPSLNSTIDYDTYGTDDYGTLPEATALPTGVTKATLNLGVSPSFAITVLEPDKNLRTTWKDPSNVSVTCSYFSKAENKEIIDVLYGTDPDTSKIEVKSTGAVVFVYSGVKLYDADKVVTMTATDGTTEYSYTGSILSMISSSVTIDGLKGDVYRALACFSASAHAFWPDY